MIYDAILLEAVRRAVPLHKSVGPHVRAEARYVIPVLAAELGDESDLTLLAEAWMQDEAALGRRVRDLADELGRRVSVLRWGIDPFSDWAIRCR